MEEKFNLRNDFPAHSFEEWKKQVELELKGESFEKKLITKTYENIDIQPIYTQADLNNVAFYDSLPGFDNFVRGNRASGYHSNIWEIAQEYKFALPEENNTAVRNDIENGLNSINIALDLPTQLGKDADQCKVGEVGFGGLSISGIRKMQALFDRINLIDYPIHIHCGFSALPFTVLFASFARELKLSLRNLRGSITSDPYDFLLKYGYLPFSLSKIFDEIKFATQFIIRSSSPIRTIGVSSYNYSNAGANVVQELAFAFSTVVDYLNELINRGLDIKAIIPKVKFTFGINSFFFMEIAKLRAARILWKNILSAYELSDDDYNIYIHTKTVDYNKTITDPYVNILRETIESFSAIIGNADAITTKPFDYLFKYSNDFSRRIARNTQIILRDESNFYQVIDPAAGSYFVEKLTFDLCQQAWDLFIKIQQLGGMFQAIKSGFVQNELKKIENIKRIDYQRRKSVLVGTNLYVNPNESLESIEVPDYQEIYKKRVSYIQKYRINGDDDKHISILEKLKKIADTNSYDLIEYAIEAYIDGATIGEVSSAIRKFENDQIIVEPLNLIRAAEPFENLKKQSENYLIKNGHKPRVFLLTFGTLKEYKARADFSRSFFETASFEIIYPTIELNNIEDASIAALESNAEIITICSTDDNYINFVPKLVKTIKEKKKSSFIILAGYPKEQSQLYKQSGIDDFIFLGCDLIKTITNIFNIINKE